MAGAYGYDYGGQPGYDYGGQPGYDYNTQTGQEDYTWATGEDAGPYGGTTGTSRTGLVATKEASAGDGCGIVCAVVICVLILVVGATLGFFFLVSPKPDEDADLGSGGSESGSSGGGSSPPSISLEPAPEVYTVLPRPAAGTAHPDGGSTDTDAASHTTPPRPEPPRTEPPRGERPDVTGPHPATSASPHERKIDTTTLTTTKTTTTTTPIPKITLFICTVGVAATSGHTYPFDGLCDQLYYSSVFIAGQELRSTSGDIGVVAFHATMKKYQKTKGGLDFDFFSTTTEKLSLQRVTKTLKDMAMDNVIHYAVFNVLAQGQGLAGEFAKAQKILAELKKLQGIHKDRQTALGLGLYPESDARSLSTYSKMFTDAVDNNVADIVIAITSLGNFNEDAGCEVLPPGFLYSQPLYPGYPNLDQYKPLLSDNSTYKKNLRIVGASLEMGAFLYTLPSELTSDTKKLVFKTCDGVSIVKPSSVCDSDTWEVSGLDGAFEYLVGFIRSIGGEDKMHLYFMESFVTIAKKAEHVMKWKPRRFAWLFLNTDLDNRKDECKATENFDRIGKVKLIFSGTP